MMIARKIGTLLASAGLLATALVLGGQAAADGLKDAKPSADVYRGVWFGGFDVVEGAHYMFQGAVVALNRDLSKDGFAVRTYGSRVDFDQDPTGDGRGWQGDVMLGYLFHRGPLNGAIYVGGDYQNYKLTPDDPTALVRGVEWGVKVAGDLATSTDLPIYFALSGSYSTAFDSYWTRMRYGFNRNRYTFGAEAQAFGNEEFDAQRLGAFLTFKVDLRPGRPLEITVSGGHQFVKDSGGGITGSGGGEGTYATVVFSMPF